MRVEGEFAEHGLEGVAGMHRGRQRPRVERVRPRCRLRDDLDRRIAVEEGAVRRLPPGLETPEQPRRGRPGAGIAREHHQGPVGRRACDVGGTRLDARQGHALVEGLVFHRGAVLQPIPLRTGLCVLQ